MGLLETIQKTAKDEIDSQPPTMNGTIKSYYNGAVTVETDDGVMENIRCVNVPRIGSACLLVPVGEEYTCIPNEFDDTAEIYAMGLGKFHINDNGYLIFELPIGKSNYMSINSNGYLIVNLDSTTNQKFKINDDGEVIYG